MQLRENGSGEGKQLIDRLAERKIQCFKESMKQRKCGEQTWNK